MIYAFGAFELDTGLFELRRAGRRVRVEPQVFSVLAHLVEHRDRVVSKNELLDSVWGDRFVSESALTTRIKAARRAVGDDGQQQHVIQTVHGRGYRFVLPVGTDGAAVAAPPQATPVPEAPATAGWPVVGRSRELELLAGWFRARETGGVLLTGGAGVGKTSLAEECLRLADAAGLPSARASGHPEGRAIPFAALAHLLPPDLASAGLDGLDRAGVFHRARAAVRERAGDERLLLLIDDGDQLDDLSRALVSSLVQSRTAFAVLTMRTLSGPTPFDHLVKDGHLMPLAVQPLNDDSIETLLHRALGGPLIADSLRRLRDAATGNAGVLRQLVETSRDAGTLVERDGVWRLAGPLRPTPSLESLVAERLEGLDDARRHAAELLAVAGEVALDVLASIVGEGPLEDLEHRGLLVVRSSSRRTSVALAHPLFAEVLLRVLPALRGRRLRRQLADAVDAVGARRREDRVRVVAWRTEGGGAVDPSLVLDAARLALLEGDDAIAEGLIRRAAEDGAGAPATELIAELHFRREDPTAVEATLGTIDLGELAEPDRARVVRRRSTNRYYGLADPDGALAVIDGVAPTFRDREVATAVQAHRGTILTMNGCTADALACTAAVLPGSRGSVRFEVLRARSVALAAAGRGEEALELVAEATALHDGFDPDLARPGRSILLFTELFALTELGRIEEARALGARYWAAGGAGARPWLAFALPRVELLAGNATEALRVSDAYALEARAVGNFSAERWVLSLAGMARLLAGDRDAGHRDLDRVARMWPEDVGLFRSDRDRALAWLAGDRDGASAAVAVLARGAGDARGRGAFALEAMLLHDAVRFGAADTVATRLAELAREGQGGLVAARAAHAAGVVGRDVGALAGVADAFEAMGAPLLAAEASVDLAEAARSRGDHGTATTASERAAALVRLLDAEVVTPSLRRSRTLTG